MSLYRKMSLLFKATAEAPARKLVADNDILIFEQEICDVEKSVKRAKLNLAQIKTEAKLVASNIEELQNTIRKREDQALAVMEKDDELAKEIALLIAGDEKQLSELNNQLSHLQRLDSKITADIKRAVGKIQEHRQKLGFLRANQHSISATRGIRDYSKGIHASMRDLNESLQSINDRQLRDRLADEAEQDVEQSIHDDVIDQKLKRIGIDQSDDDASQILKRLAAQKQERQNNIVVDAPSQ